MVLLAIAPAWALMWVFTHDPPWKGLVLGLLALAAAWVGGERIILRRLRILLQAADRLAAGD